MTDPIKLEDFDIKGFKTFRGMEGGGFNATLTLNKKDVAFLMDEGNGGELRIEWKEGHWKMPANVKEFLASDEAVKIAIKRELAFREEYKFRDDAPLPMTWDQSDFVEYLIEKHEEKKKLKKLAKKHGLVFQPSTEAGSSKLSYYPGPKGKKQWSSPEIDLIEARARITHNAIVVLARADD